MENAKKTDGVNGNRLDALRGALRPVSSGIDPKTYSESQAASAREALLYLFNSGSKGTLKLRGQIKYTLKDIEAICPIIGANWNTGKFISNAINNIIQEGDVVTLNFGGRIVDNLGSHLKCGTVIIDGDAGNCVGLSMNGGSIVVKGDTGSSVGEFMTGGSIAVNGNAGHEVGYYMRGGRIEIGRNAENLVGEYMTGDSIEVKGDVGSDLGYLSKGGKINVGGKIGRISSECRANVYRNGKRISGVRLWRITHMSRSQ